MHDARVFHFSLFVHIEDDGECQFLFVGAEGTDEVTQPFGQHRDGTVYQINGCGAFFGFFVDDAAFFYVVGHVGNVYAYFPKPGFSLRMERASSKSLASLGSMVKVVTLRKSSRWAYPLRKFRRVSCRQLFLRLRGRHRAGRIRPGWRASRWCYLLRFPRMSITWPMGFLALSAIPPPLRWLCRPSCRLSTFLWG